MTTTLHNPASRTVHLRTTVEETPLALRRIPTGKGLRLNELRVGESARIVRLTFVEGGCRKRFAEMGLAEGMKVTVASTGDTLLLIMGNGTSANRMAMAARCACDIIVARIG